MTDKALNYKYIKGVEMPAEDLATGWAVEVDGVVAPDFKGLTMTGWSLNKEGTGAKTNLADLAGEVSAAVKDGIVVVYANYTYDEQVEVETQDEIIKMINHEVIDNIAYFDVSIQLKGAKAIEAGVIVTMTESYKDSMTIELSGKDGVAFVRTDAMTDGYVNQNVLHTAGVTSKTPGTVWARGYVVVMDAEGNVSPVYTPVYSLELA